MAYFRVIPFSKISSKMSAGQNANFQSLLGTSAKEIAHMKLSLYVIFFKNYIFLSVIKMSRCVRITESLPLNKGLKTNENV